MVIVLSAVMTDNERRTTVFICHSRLCLVAREREHVISRCSANQMLSFSRRNSQQRADRA